MMGLAPPTAAPALTSQSARAAAPANPPAHADGGLRQTMIGIAPLGPGGQMPGYSQPPPTLSDPGRAGNSSVPAVPPGIADRYASPPPLPEAPAARPATAGGTVPHLSPHQKTMMGVARPGIAPLNPGQPKALTHAPVQPPQSGQQVPPAPGGAAYPAGTGSPRPLGAPPARTSRNTPVKQGIPAVAAIAMVGAAALFAAAAVVWLFYRGHGAIEARATALADGAEQLDLTCAACDDGSIARLDAASAPFSGHHATLPLSRPLKVGENPLTLTLVDPRGKQSFVDISVPVAFRVRGDTTGLEAPVPELRVLVSAVAGSTVTVDSKAVALGPDGEGKLTIDVSAEVTGLDPNVKPLERRVPYVVTPPSGSAQSGTVTLQAGITPLVIDAPGAAVVLDSSNFVLAGRTAKAGALTVGDRPITVDPTGRFAQMMNVSAPGETTIVIRATSKDTAPRLFPLRVKRVDSLAHEAERVRLRATSNYAAIADQAESKRGWAVTLEGTVIDARTENYNTVVVMDVRSGCTHAPCLARITYGAPYSLSRGDKLSAFGEVAGLVDGPRSGTRIPDVHADFLIKAVK